MRQWKYGINDQVLQKIFKSRINAVFYYVFQDYIGKLNHLKKVHFYTLNSLKGHCPPSSSWTFKKQRLQRRKSQRPKKAIFSMSVRHFDCYKSRMIIIPIHLFCSSYQGWDNPFRPEGELSNDAEEILRLWKEGKLKDFSLLLKANNNSSANEPSDKAEATDDVDNTKAAAATSSEPLLKNGSASAGPSQNGSSVKSNHYQNSNQSQPLRSSEKVKIGGDEPKKKQGCCALMWK